MNLLLGHVDRTRIGNRKRLRKMPRGTPGKILLDEYCVDDLAALVVEVKFLLARNGHAIIGSGSEDPLPDRGHDCLVDGWVQTPDQSQLSDFAVVVDDGIQDNVAFRAVGER